MMCDENDKIEKVEKFIEVHGLDLYQIVGELGKKKSSTLNLNSDDHEKFQVLYNDIQNNVVDGSAKGKMLEELISVLFNNPEGSFFECRKNCRTSTNEIDLLLTWNESSRMMMMHMSFPCFGDEFLCECKNYKDKVDVTCVGKFYSLLSMSKAKLGILVSWNGIKGRGGWDSAKGLIKKIALKDEIYIVVIDKDDLKKICIKKDNIYSMIYDKYQALKMDIDFNKYKLKHPASDCLFHERIHTE